MPRPGKRPLVNDDEDDYEDERGPSTRAPPRRRQERVRAEEPVVEDGEQDNSEAGEQDENENDRASRQLSDDQLVKAFVRYVLTCEHSRTVIRRDAINQRILGSQSRRFKQIFALAQDRLCNVFGLELRELPAKEVYTQAAKRKALKASATQGSGSGGTSTQAPGSTQSAAASAATGAGAGTGQYVLVSCLARPFRVPPIIVPPASASAGASPSAGSRGGAVASTQAGGTGGDGSTLHEDSAAFVAFYTVVIALLYLNNGSGTLAWLRRQLMPLGCHESVAAAGGEKTDVVLARLARLGYLVRVVDKDTAGGGGGAGGDAPGIEDETVNFFIGPRGKVEVGPEGVARLVRKVWRVGGGGRHGGTRLRPGEVDEDLEKRLRASLNLPAAGGAEGGDASGGTQAVPEEA